MISRNRWLCVALAMVGTFSLLASSANAQLFRRRCCPPPVCKWNQFECCDVCCSPCVPAPTCNPACSNCECEVTEANGNYTVTKHCPSMLCYCPLPNSGNDKVTCAPLGQAPQNDDDASRVFIDFYSLDSSGNDFQRIQGILLASDSESDMPFNVVLRDMGWEITGARRGDTSNGGPRERNGGGGEQSEINGFVDVQIYDGDDIKKGRFMFDKDDVRKIECGFWEFTIMKTN